MTTQEYFAYCLDYQQRLADAFILARRGLADPTPEDLEALSDLYDEENVDPTPEDLEELEDLYDEEDPFTISDEPLVFARCVP